MSQIYNDNTKNSKPKQNQLGILVISAREYTRFAGNSAEKFSRKIQRKCCWGYIPIYENTPKKLLHLSPKGWCNFI